MSLLRQLPGNALLLDCIVERYQRADWRFTNCQRLLGVRFSS